MADWGMSSKVVIVKYDWHVLVGVIICTYMQKHVFRFK